MKYLYSLFILFSVLGSAQEVELVEKTSLPKKIKETSGLLWDGKNLITHNDSNGKAKLYVVDEKKGSIKRVVKVKGVKNIDWEDLAQDDTHIYIADTGNNSGYRSNLVIHKISKKDFYKGDEVVSEKIYFNYKNQQINNKSKGKNNFDCEAITICDNKILLMSKNWENYRTDVYTLPTLPGNYSIAPISTLKVNCLITGMDYHKESKKLVAIAYDKNQKSYLIEFDDIASGFNSFSKINLTPLLNDANQIEGVAFKDKNEVYITRERNSKKVKGHKYKHKEKLFLFKLKSK
ncbi:hypothetical protein ACXGQW_02160 [Wenyingzhuangia sp. IMCC45533]